MPTQETQCEQVCERCGREETLAIDPVSDDWELWPSGWWVVWPELYVLDMLASWLEVELVCPDCYRAADSEGMSHAIQGVSHDD